MPSARAMVPSQTANGNVTFNKSSNDGLNDCERFLLGGQVGTFSSAGDLVPDFFGSINFLPILAGRFRNRLPAESVWRDGYTQLYEVENRTACPSVLQIDSGSPVERNQV